VRQARAAAGERKKINLRMQSHGNQFLAPTSYREVSEEPPATLQGSESRNHLVVVGWRCIAFNFLWMNSMKSICDASSVRADSWINRRYSLLLDSGAP